MDLWRSPWSRGFSLAQVNLYISEFLPAQIPKGSSGPSLAAGLKRRMSSAAAAWDCDILCSHGTKQALSSQI